MNDSIVLVKVVTVEVVFVFFLSVRLSQCQDYP